MIIDISCPNSKRKLDHCTIPLSGSISGFFFSKIITQAQSLPFSQSIQQNKKELCKWLARKGEGDYESKIMPVERSVFVTMMYKLVNILKSLFLLKQSTTINRKF